MESLRTEWSEEVREQVSLEPGQVRASEAGDRKSLFCWAGAAGVLVEGLIISLRWHSAEAGSATFRARARPA